MTIGTLSRPALRGSPAALAGDDLVAAVGLADDDWLDDAVRSNRARELLNASSSMHRV